MLSTLRKHALVAAAGELRVDFRWLGQLYAVVAICAVTLPWIIWRKMDAIRYPVEVTIVALMQFPPILVITFVAMRLDLPMADPLLLQMDRELGLDWPTYVRLVDRSPALSWILGVTYESAFPQLVLLPGALCFLGYPQRAYRVVFCYGTLVIVSVLIAAFFPSVSAYAGYGFDVESLRNINSSNGYRYISAFEAVIQDLSWARPPLTA